MASNQRNDHFQDVTVTGTLTLANGVTLAPQTNAQEVKPVTNPGEIGTAALKYNVFANNLTVAGTSTVTGALNLSGGGVLGGTFTGNPTLSGNPTFSGSTTLDTVTVGKWNNIRIVDGVKFTTIQAAHDDLPATGGEILVPAGTYTTVTISKSNVVLRGTGHNTILTAPAATNNIVNITGSHVRVTDIQIQGQATNDTTGQTGIIIQADQNEVDHVFFSGTSGSNGLNIQVNVFNANKNLIHDNVLTQVIGTTSNHGYGIILVNGSENQVFGNRSVQSATQGRHHVYVSQGAKYNLVFGNRLSGGVQSAIPIYATDVQSSASYNIVSGNVITGTVLTGNNGVIEIDNNADHNKILNNIIVPDATSTLGYGVYVYDAGGTTTPTNNEIIGNTVVNAPTFAFYAFGAGSNRFLNNTSLGASQVSAGTYGAFAVQSDNPATADGNEFIGNTATGATTQRHGLQIYATAPAPSATIVGGNVWGASVVSAVTDGGTGTLFTTNINAGVPVIAGQFDTQTTGNVFKINGTQITDKTGTGKAVLDTSPTLATPVLGAATGSSLILTAATPTAAASQTAFGNSTAATATNGTGEAMKANVEGYLIVNVAGTDVKVPYVKS